MAAIDARDARNDVLLACTIGDISWLKRGFSNGAEPTATNDEGLNGLHLAAKHGQVECIKYLLDECGIDVNCAAISAGNTALHYSIAYANTTKSIQCTKLLLSRGGIYKCQNKLGETPLHIAAKHGSIKIVKLLLEKGASIQIKDKEGHTPYDTACIHSHHECARLLRALQWASKKDSVEREKLRKEEIRRKQRNAELARQQRLRREAADRSYSQWLEKKDLESNRQSTYAGEREDSTYSRSTLSSCGASRHSHASVTKVNPQLTCSIKVNPKQAKRNISSIGKPDKMQPYTNYPPKSSLRHASVHCGLGKSKSEPSRSGRSSRATVRSAASVPAGVRYYSKLHQQQQGTKKEQKKKEDGKCDMVELLEKEDSRDKTKQEHQATHQEMSEDDRDDKGQNEEPELWDSQQEVVYDGDCEAEHDELPASLQVALSGVDIAVVHDGESGNKDISTATSGTTKGDPVVQDLEDEGDETELTNLPVDEEEADELDFSKLQVNDPTLIGSTGCIVEGEEDDLFHDVGHTNSLNALSLPNTVTKDRTPAEVIQLLRSLGGLSKSYNRSYSFSHSFGLAQRSRFHRRLSLGAIPEGQIVTSYSDEDQSTSQIIDSDFLESLVLNLGGDHREEKKDVWRPGSHTKRPNNIADGVSSESESDDSDTLSRSSSNDSVVGQVAVVEDEVISDPVSISPAEELEILGQYDTSGPVIRPQSLKIVNLAWNPCLNAVQSHITEAPLSVPDHPNRSGGCTPTHRTPTPSPHRESTEQPSSPSTSESRPHQAGSNCSPSPITHSPKNLPPSSSSVPSLQSSNQ